METLESFFWTIIILCGAAGIFGLLALIADFCEWLADRCE